MPNYSSGTINIPNVTGNIVITATATAATVTSISAVFNQGQNVIYDTDSLDTLKQYLTVTATYTGGATAVVTGYTLSGTLTEGTSTITVTYSGKTTTFNVTVTAVTMLFKNGNEYTTLTGGYTKTTGFNSGNISHTEENDGEYLFWQYNAKVSNANARSLSTVNQINLTNFSKIVCVYESYMPDGAGNLWLYYSSTIANATSADSAYGSGSNNRRFWITGANGWTDANEHTIEFDISEISGSYYLSGCFNVWSNAQSGTYAKIRELYLI